MLHFTVKEYLFYVYEIMTYFINVQELKIQLAKYEDTLQAW